MFKETYMDILDKNMASKDHFELKFLMNQNRGLNVSSHLISARISHLP